jgi:AraC family transcriptional regulator, transcriptional activator of pobA
VRYAAALAVTEDKLHAHCKREKGVSPRAIVHLRLIEEACMRLQQLDLPVEQIGYGLWISGSRLFQPHLSQALGHFAGYLPASLSAGADAARRVLRGVAVVY